MKKIILLGFFFGLFSTESSGNKAYTPKIFSFWQCSPELAQNQYRAYFENVDGNEVNDGRSWLSLAPFSSLVEKCIRTTELHTIKSFMAHFLLKHIQDARIAADGLGRDASMNQSLYDASNMGSYHNLDTSANLLPGVIGSLDQLGRVADNQVNKRRPNFETAYKRMIFFRYGILSYKDILKASGLLDSSGHKTATYSKDAANTLITEAVSSRKDLLSKAYNKGSVTPDSPESVKIIVGKFDWEDIKRVLPDVAKELEDTLERMHQIKKSLDAYQLYKLSPSKPTEPFAPPLPSAIPALVFPIAQIAE